MLRLAFACPLLLVLLLLAGCASQNTYPTLTGVTVLEAPKGGGFVVVYPAAKAGGPSLAKSATTVLRPLEGFRLSCSNAPCEVAYGSYIRLRGVPSGADHLEIKVEKEGFEPGTLVVPFREGAPENPHYVVLLRTGGAK